MDRDERKREGQRGKGNKRWTETRERKRDGQERDRERRVVHHYAHITDTHHVGTVDVHHKCFVY